MLDLRTLSLLYKHYKFNVCFVPSPSKKRLTSILYDGNHSRAKVGDIGKNRYMNLDAVEVKLDNTNCWVPLFEVRGSGKSEEEAISSLNENVLNKVKEFNRVIGEERPESKYVFFVGYLPPTKVESGDSFLSCVEMGLASTYEDEAKSV